MTRRVRRLTPPALALIAAATVGYFTVDILSSRVALWDMRNHC